MLTVEEAIVVASHRHTLLPLGAGLHGLQPTVPHLIRSALHRCLERHGISRLPEIDGDQPRKQRFAAYAIEYVRNDLAEVITADGKLRLFVAVDPASKTWCWRGSSGTCGRVEDRRRCLPAPRLGARSPVGSDAGSRRDWPSA